VYDWHGYGYGRGWIPLMWIGRDGGGKSSNDLTMTAEKGNSGMMHLRRVFDWFTADAWLCLLACCLLLSCWLF